MNLKDFSLISSDDNREIEQCVLCFSDSNRYLVDYHLSIIRYKTKDVYEIEFYVCGNIKNPFKADCTGTIYNISEEKINQYITLLTILTGSPPIQI